MLPARPLHFVLVAALGAGALACTTSSDPAPASELGSSAPPASPEENTPIERGASAESAPLPQSWGPQYCAPADGAARGFGVGDPIGELGLQDCDTGEEASIDELCGADATWVFVAHTHCPTCQATAGFTDEIAAAVAGKNVAIAHVVYDDNGTSCAKWRTAYKLAGISNVRVYASPDGGAFAKLETNDYTAPSAFLDARRVITFKEHGLSKSAVLDQIDAALTQSP